MSKYDEDLIFYWKNGVRRCFRLNNNKLNKTKVKKKVKNGKAHYIKEEDKKLNVSDITQEFIKNSTPNKGKMEFAPNYNYEENKDEIETAYWMMRKFGGNIYLNEPNNNPEHEGISNPDYIWNGKWWDLKGVKTLNGVSKRLQDGIYQINNNSDYKAGGVILDITGSVNSREEVFKTIRSRLFFTANSPMYVVVKKEDDVFLVVEYK